MENINKLKEDIQLFLDTYAKINPNWDGIEEDEKYTGPDPYEFVRQITLLHSHRKIINIHSEWGSCCYGPYDSIEGREMHDSLLKRCREL